MDQFHDQIVRMGVDEETAAPFVQRLYRRYDELRANALANMAEIIAKRLGHDGKVH